MAHGAITRPSFVFAGWLVQLNHAALQAVCWSCVVMQPLTNDPVNSLELASLNPMQDATRLPMGRER